MRLFPRTAGRRLAAATLACSVAVGAVAVPLAGAEDLKDRQRQVEKEIEHAHDELEHSSDRLRRATVRLEAAIGQLRDAKAELADARARLVAARVLDRRMQERLELAEDRLADARAALVDGQDALEEQRLRVTDTITAIYEQGDPELLAFASLLEAETPADLTRRSAARDVMVGRETRAYDDLHAAEVLLQVREDNVEQATEDVAEQRRDAAAHLVTMEGLHEETRLAKVKVRDLVNDRRAARKDATRARKRDRAVLDRLRARERRIEQRIREQARRARARGVVGHRGATGGMLMRPVDGPVTSPYGYREHPIYHYWGMHDGTDFGVACGQPMYAVDSGTVTSAYSSSVYGRRLYLSVGMVNGRNLTAVYNHASRYVVGPGDRVQRGQLVGYAGSTGWSTGCHLHFTTLLNGSPTNPMQFF